MIRVAIVEDEASYLEQIQGFIKQYQIENDQTIEVTIFSDGLHGLRKVNVTKLDNTLDLMEHSGLTMIGYEQGFNRSGLKDTAKLDAALRTL